MPSQSPPPPKGFGLRVIDALDMTPKEAAGRLGMRRPEFEEMAKAPLDELADTHKSPAWRELLALVAIRRGELQSVERSLENKLEADFNTMRLRRQKMGE